jgi:predicted Zn-dependent protease
MKTLRTHAYLVVTILALLFLSACTVNPVTLKREFNVVSEEREIRLGRNAAPAVAQQFGGVYDDYELQKYIDEVGQRLVAVCDRNYLQYQFHVIDSPILNAFALPGGFIFITRGLLAELENEAQLAGVLAHEIGHVVARHSATQLSEAIGYQALTLASVAAGPNAGNMVMVTTALSQSMMLGYSREREFQSDTMGLIYMHRAEYDPLEMSKFLSILSEKSQGPTGYGVYSSTHPDVFERISVSRSKAKLMLALDITQDKLKQKNGQGEAEVTKEELIAYKGNVLEDEYKSHLEGLLYGPRRNPHRIHIHTVREGETILSIADEILRDRSRVEEIAELNDMKVDTPLRPGKKLKIIY